MAARAGFAAVDRDPDAQGLVAALGEQAALPAVQRLRATALDQLAVGPGDRVLDAGCGTGEVTRQLARVVADRGAAIGVDSSETMLRAARLRTLDSPPELEYHLGDITRLDFSDASFDAAYSERVFQHLPEPRLAMTELVRVTRPCGRIVVVDTDWGMHAIGGADPFLTKRVVEAWVDHTPNGWSGRQLPVLFATAGLVDVTVMADTIISARMDGPTSEPFTTMADTARMCGALTQAEAQRWLEQLVDATAAGSFFWAITMFLVAGRRP